MKPERIKPRVAFIDDLDPTERYLLALDCASYKPPGPGRGGVVLKDRVLKPNVGRHIFRPGLT